MYFHLGQQLGGWEYYGRVGTVFFLGGEGVSTSDKCMGDWFILFNAGTFSFFCFQNFLIAKKRMVENISASLAKKEIVENVRAMPSPLETSSPGRTDTPNEATPLAQCSLSRKRKVDQEECFPTDFISKGLD